MKTLLISFILAFAANDELNDLVKDSKIGILSTTYDKSPFTSLMPYVVDSEGQPVILISVLAQHTKNLDKDAKCSFMVYKVDKNNLFNSSRVTFVGTMEKIGRKEFRQAYLKKYPKAKQFIDFGGHDFQFYKMKIENIYYIGGFGNISWLNVKRYNKEFDGK